MSLILRNVLTSILFVIFIVLPYQVKAQDFKSAYKAEYFLSTNQGRITASVKFAALLTNLRSDIYVKKFSIIFPMSFEIKNIKAYDDKGAINPSVTTEGSKINIQLEFNDPNIGKTSVNTFNLEFDQENLFKVNGNVWEVILPVIDDKTSDNYQVIVHLPLNEEKKVSISKPKPDEIKGNTITWNNPKVKTIYAVFGDKQYYQTKLSYHLRNPKIIPAYADIAFPPDTLYQKIFINNIVPAPSYTYIDEDGNFKARYLLKPKENLNILFDGVIEVLSQPRSELQPLTREKFQNQKIYLLTQKSFWELPTSSNIKVGKSPKEVYDFVVDNLKYYYEGLSKKDLKRLGAAQALVTPEKAVCVEFTDLFIAIAREKGLYSREIQGYGFSNDQKLRPLSLIADVLHSWPEYYNDRTGLWVPIDPTWENTSGIDYFSSFDLNHIAFAIHGKNPDSPAPAGSYKLADTKDVSIVAVSSRPDEQTNVGTNQINLPSQITDKGEYETKITVVNNSNVFLYDLPVEFISDNLVLSPDMTTIASFAPYEKKEIILKYKSLNKNKKTKANLSVSVMKNNVFTGTIVILPYYYQWGIYIGYGVIGISALILFFKLILRKRPF
ncbi:MAG: transglutaminase domain-containing protein [Candidatus Roizmanbacteria bacterium]|nr:MAG: transglutaminase domain-containing protein [Candidatus Roizmanbacteria bacterium]